ncbi:MAG: response regulator, partial [Myxococcales bacterium]|nr:response regulator [Myxococcales bacterium]
MAICIHVIESDDTLATQLTGTLEAFGATVVRATDGAEGIRAAIAERPALVLLGLMDDKGAGYALCSKLRRKARDLPVVMVVDAAEQDARRLAEHRTLNTAADAYLQRPFSVRALHDTLGSLLGEPLTLPSQGLEVLIGDASEGQFEGLFDGEADADIEAATDKWFDSIMTPDSMPPPVPPRVAPQSPLEELEINLDELVPPAEDEVFAALRRENANLRDRVAELEAARAVQAERSSPGSTHTSARRELLEMRQRLNDREREVVELRDKYTQAEAEAIELEEAVEALRAQVTRLEARLDDAEGRARREAAAHEEAEAHVQRLRNQLGEERTIREEADRRRADAEEELVPLRAELEGIKK